MPRLRIQLLGALRVLRDEQPVPLPAKKAQALLAFLALQPDRPHARARLAALLWAEAGDSAARASLRQALLVLRRALTLGDDELCSDADTVMLRASAADTDTLEFERLSGDGSDVEALERAAALVRGELLESFDARAEAFDEWLAVERQRLRGRTTALLQRLLEMQAAAGRAEPAIETGLRLLALDPLHEPVHRALMALYARQGRHDAALRQFELCRELLQRELGALPQAATQQLRDGLVQRRAREGAEPAPAAPADARHDAELRPVAVVCIEAADSDDEHDPERAHALAAAWAAAMRTAAERCGATLLGDPAFGTTALLLFGAPRASGDDTTRAAHCALEMRSPARRIGLAAGLALLTHVPFGVAGEPITAASRLGARAAPGEVLVNPGAWQALREPDGEPGGDPGDTARAHWRLRALGPASAAPLVGRRAEQAQFEAALRNTLESGCGSWLHLRGEPGIGKTRLVDRFCELARDAGFICHRGAALDFGAEHDALHRVVRELLAPGGEATIAGAIAAGHVEAADEPQLHDLLHLPQPAAWAAHFAALDEATREQRGRDALARLLLRAAAAQPRLVVVEDLHWASPRTSRHVMALAQACERGAALLVTTARSESDPLDASWRAAAGVSPWITLDLGPLRTAEARALAERMGNAAGDAFTLGCIERAGGNPLFLEQLLRVGPAPDALPATVQSVVIARLDRLPAAVRRALRVASVLGQRFSLTALAQGLGEPLPDARPVQGLLRVEGDDGQFAHALVHEAAYASLPRAQRRVLHARAAAWYAGRDATLRAEHLERADDPAAAAAYLDAAREQAAQQRRERALQLTERGLARADDDSRGGLAALRAELLHDAGAMRESQAAWQTALDAAADDAARARAWLGLAASRRMLDDLGGAADALAEAARLAAATGDADALARVHLQRGNLLFPKGDLDGCLREHRVSLQLARKAHSIEIEAAAQGGIGDAEYLRGRMVSAHARYRDCIDLAQRHGCTRIEVANRPMLAWTRWFGSDAADALADARQAIDAARQIGHLRAEMIAQHCAYQSAHARADAEAPAHAERSLALARQLEAPRFIAEGLAFRGEARCADGAVAAGLADLRESVAMARASGLAFMGATFLGLLAAASDDATERDAALAEGEALLHDHALAHNHLLFRRSAIDVCLDLGDADAARRHADALDAFTRPEPLPWADFFVARGRVLAAWLAVPRERPRLVAELERLHALGLRLGLRRATDGLDAALRRH